MKTYVLYLLFVVIIMFVFMRLACKRNPLNGQLFPKEVQRSVIGITGKDSSAPYIEIFYTRKKTDTSNEVVHEWVKPPYLFGDIPVISHIRKTCFENGMSKGCRDWSYFTFTEGGDSYLKIINHSNEPIEIFITVNFPAITYGSNGNFSICKECDNNNYLSSHPRPMYKNAPIYYLLYPNKTPNKVNMNIINFNNYCCTIKNLSYTPSQVGDIAINRPCTIEEVMALYRAEYHHSPDTILFAHYLGVRDNLPIRISEINTNSNYHSTYTDQYGTYDVYEANNMFGFYKKINAIDSFLSIENQWYPMTNSIELKYSDSFSP